MVIPLNNPARTISSHEVPGRFAHHFVQIHTNVTISTKFSLTKVLYLCKFVSFRGFHGIFHGLASLRLVDLNHNLQQSLRARMVSSLPEASGSKFYNVIIIFKLDSLASLRLVDLNIYCTDYVIPRPWSSLPEASGSKFLRIDNQ